MGFQKLLLGYAIVKSSHSFLTMDSGTNKCQILDAWYKFHKVIEITLWQHDSAISCWVQDKTVGGGSSFVDFNKKCIKFK